MPPLPNARAHFAVTAWASVSQHTYIYTCAAMAAMEAPPGPVQARRKQFQSGQAHRPVSAMAPKPPSPRTPKAKYTGNYGKSGIFLRV